MLIDWMYGRKKEKNKGWLKHFCTEQLELPSTEMGKAESRVDLVESREISSSVVLMLSYRCLLDIQVEI